MAKSFGVLLKVANYRFSSLILRVITAFGLLVVMGSCSDGKPPTGRMPPVLTLGKAAPDFAFQMIQDGEFNPEHATDSLNNYKGKVVYLDFWASWCKPCLKSMPLLNDLRAELGRDDFEVIAVNLDINASLGQEFLADHPVDYLVVRTDDSINELYKIKGLPTSYFIDKDGILRYAHQGFKVEDMKKIRQQLMSLLK
ncbi:MAG: TlpA family protein disulfide reductase [Gammaproteobacteria bacterium]|nr:MAG: TlpA family protein disulfide reductase [Gammaproteobacteria bacterium]